MGSRFSLEATVKMIDRVTGPMKQAGNSVTAFNKKTQKQFDHTQKFAQRANKQINRVGGTAAKGALAGLGVAIGLVGREYMQFDDAIFGATARFKAAEKPGTDMTKVMENLRKAARATGAATQFTATQASEGLNKFALAGFTSEEAIKSLRSQVDLATVTGEDFMRVADISSDLLGAFGGAALSSEKKIEKLKQMNALLAVGTLSANVTMEDLFETLKDAAPIATKAGASMKDIIATTSVLGSAGIKGTQAGTMMKNMFARLASPTKEVQKGFALLNLEQKDFITGAGKLKGTQKIFAAISKKTKGMTDVESLEVFKKVFGMRGMAGAAVLEKNIGAVREQMIRMGKDPQKVMQQTADFMRRGMGVKLKILGSAAQDLGFKFFKAFSKDGKSGIDSLTKAIQGFNPQPIIDFLKFAVMSIQFLYRALAPIAPELLIIVGVFKAWAAAQTLINFLMSANPIGLVIIAVAALGAALRHLYTNWDIYMLSANIKMQEWISNWKMLKFHIMDALSKLGIFTSKEVMRAELGARISLAKEDLMKIKRINLIQSKGGTAQSQRLRGMGVTTPATPSGFASPNSRAVSTTNTTTNNGRVDINFKAPKDTIESKQSGSLPMGIKLNFGTSQ